MLCRQWINAHSDVSNPVLYRKLANVDDLHDILNEVYSRLASSISLSSPVVAHPSKKKWLRLNTYFFSIIEIISSWQSRIRDRRARRSSGRGWYSRMMTSRVSVAQLI
jgi:hypothetical protein